MKTRMTLSYTPPCASSETVNEVGTETTAAAGRSVSSVLFTCGGGARGQAQSR